jgi:hypothetical protein
MFVLERLIDVAARRHGFGPVLLRPAATSCRRRRMQYRNPSASS